MKGGSHLLACIRSGTWAGQSTMKHGLVRVPTVPLGEITAKDDTARSARRRTSTLPALSQATLPYEPGGIFSPIAQMMKLRYQASHGETAQEQSWHSTPPLTAPPCWPARGSLRPCPALASWESEVVLFHFNRGIWVIGTGSEPGSGCKPQCTAAPAGWACSGFQTLHEGSALFLKPKHLRAEQSPNISK